MREDGLRAVFCCLYSGKDLMNILNRNAPIIIGIDHGYGNIKTANCCFKTGVAFL